MTHRAVWIFGVLIFTTALGAGGYLLGREGAVIGFALVLAGSLGLAIMWSARPATTTAALGAIAEAALAYVTGAWFWWRDRE